MPPTRTVIDALRLADHCEKCGDSIKEYAEDYTEHDVMKLQGKVHLLMDELLNINRRKTEIIKNENHFQGVKK